MIHSDSFGSSCRTNSRKGTSAEFSFFVVRFELFMRRSLDGLISLGSTVVSEDMDSKIFLFNKHSGQDEGYM